MKISFTFIFAMVALILSIITYIDIGKKIKKKESYNINKYLKMRSGHCYGKPIKKGEEKELVDELSKVRSKIDTLRSIKTDDDETNEKIKEQIIENEILYNQMAQEKQEEPEAIRIIQQEAPKEIKIIEAPKEIKIVEAPKEIKIIEAPKEIKIIQQEAPKEIVDLGNKKIIESFRPGGGIYVPYQTCRN